VNSKYTLRKKRCYRRSVRHDDQMFGPFGNAPLLISEAPAEVFLAESRAAFAPLKFSAIDGDGLFGFRGESILLCHRCKGVG
jgi:hypothetical protein